MKGGTNWTKASVSLLTFAFINMVLFIVLSMPVGQVFNIVEDQANETGVGDDVTPIMNMWRTVFGVTFVFSFVGLIVWFVMGSHEQEGEDY